MAEQLLADRPYFADELETDSSGERVYHNVLAAVGQAVDLDDIVYTEEVDLARQLRMSDLYSPGAVRRTSLIGESTGVDGLSAYTKYETEQDINAFKVRGAFMGCSLALQEDPTIRDFVAVSAGNHGQGVAQFVNWFNARLVATGAIRVDGAGKVLPSDEHLVARAHIFCPEGASTEKVAKSEALGAVVHRIGYKRLEDASKGADEFMQHSSSGARTARPIHPFNQPEVMAGQALILLETLQQLREQGVDVRQRPLELYVGGGGFGLANGNAALLDHLVSLDLVHPDSYVVAVQMEGCDAMNRALQRLDQGNDNMTDLFVDENGKDTFDPSSDGTAVVEPGDQSLALAHHLKQSGRLVVMTVTKAELGATMRSNRAYGRRVEPAGALAEAGRRKREQALVPYYPNYPEWQQRITVAVQSGGNASDAALQEFYSTYPLPKELPAGAVRPIGSAVLSGVTAGHHTKLVVPGAKK